MLENFSKKIESKIPLFLSTKKQKELVQSAVNNLIKQHQDPRAKARFKNLTHWENIDTVWNDIYLKNLNTENIKTKLFKIEKMEYFYGFYIKVSGHYAPTRNNLLKKVVKKSIELENFKEFEKKYKHNSIEIHTLQKVKGFYSALVHELTHKMTDSNNRIDMNTQKILKQELRICDEYYGKPTEIHARLNQIRAMTRSPENAYENYSIIDLEKVDWHLLEPKNSYYVWYERFKNGKESVVNLLNAMF